MVIVDQGNRPRHLLIIMGPLHLHQLVADEIADRFRAVGIAPADNLLIESIEKFQIDGDSKADYFSHIPSFRGSQLPLSGKEPLFPYPAG